MTADKIDRACRHLGSFYVVNHRVPSEVIEAAFRASRAFFTLPLDQKMKLHVGKCPPYRGYVRIFERKQGTAALIGMSRSEGDFKEGLDFGPGLPPDDPGVRPGNPFYGPNVWPVDLLEFRPAIETYVDACKSLAYRLLEAFATSLELHRTYFADKFDRALMRLKLLHYPEQDPLSADPVVGTGVHTDYGCLTIVANDSVQGLEVLGDDGQWIPVPPLDGAFFINLGDQMARWTDDRYRATPHRVVNRSGRDRYSIAFFVHPNFDAMIASLAAPRSKPRTSKYPPIRAGDDLLARLGNSGSSDADRDGDQES